MFVILTESVYVEPRFLWFVFSNILHLKVKIFEFLAVLISPTNGSSSSITDLP